MTAAEVIKAERVRVRADFEAIRERFMSGAMGNADFERAVDRLIAEAALLGRLLDRISPEAK